MGTSLLGMWRPALHLVLIVCEVVFDGCPTQGPFWSLGSYASLQTRLKSVLFLNRISAVAMARSMQSLWEWKAEPSGQFQEVSWTECRHNPRLDVRFGAWRNMARRETFNVERDEKCEHSAAKTDGLLIINQLTQTLLARRFPGFFALYLSSHPISGFELVVRPLHERAR